MSKKVDRAVHGPGWGEVILGAFLSLALGVVLGATFLIAKPVAQVKELPKEEERNPNTVYYVEGSRDSSKARQALLKRKAFVEGQSVSITEDEINSLVPAAKAALAAAPGGEKKGDQAEPSSDGEAFSVGMANFRVRDGKVQVGAPVTLNVMGVVQKIVVQARGTIVKRGDMFVFDPSEIYLGSCPVQRLPFLVGYVEKKFLAAQTIPEDIATAWRSLTDVSVEGNVVKLTAR